MTITPGQAVDAANEVFGRHPGYRAPHAKGTLCRGTFTAAPAGAAMTRAAPMRGEPVPATIRFSNGGGDPQAPDDAPDVRGLAVKLYLPDGSHTDIVAQTAPRFPSRTPEGFVELMHASHPGLAMPFKFARFLARNPAAIRGLPANAAALRPPVSYAAVPYYAIHAFRWIDGDRGCALRALHMGASGPGSLAVPARAGGDVLIFDPTRVTDGIELSADPILQFRSGAYSASVERRMPSR